MRVVFSFFFKGRGDHRDLPYPLRRQRQMCIRYRYNPGRNDYGVILSIDGNGSVTRHFPESGWTAVKMKHSGSEIPLDFSYELDDAPDFECFILVASKKAFSLEGIDEEIAASSVDVDFIQVGNYLPSGTDRTAFLLRK